MIKLKSVIYLISMMTLAGCSGQKQASVTDYFPMPDAKAAGKMGRE